MTETATAHQTKYDFRNPRPLPETIPLRDDLTDVAVAFSTAGGYLHNGGAYLNYYEGQCGLVPREWTEKASHLFFRGGSLADVGLQLKPGIDPATFRANLRWLSSSWEPKHEEKEATVGFALQQWCEPLKVEPTAHQAQRKKPRKGGAR